MMWEWLVSTIRVLSISYTFYLVVSFPCLVQIMTIQVIAEREHKIRTEVKEIQKVFFCSLCNKQYKLAHEFESHLSSYDHNHRKVIHFACSFDFPNALYWLFFWICSSAPFVIPLFCRGLKKWEKCRAAVVAVMTGRNVNNNGKRRN